MQTLFVICNNVHWWVIHNSGKAKGLGGTRPLRLKAGPPNQIR